MKAEVHIASNVKEDPGHELSRAKNPFILVIFGAFGDLGRRKLIPALYHQNETGYRPDRYAAACFYRTEMTDDAYRDKMFGTLREYVETGSSAVQANNALVQTLYYHPGNNDNLESSKTLKAKLDAIDTERGLPGNRLFYMSVASEFFITVIRNLCEAGLICDTNADPWSRVIIEKPFGHDLDSSRTLNAVVTALLDESQIYRIDHYLGKETVQNIFSFRFGNSIFEPLFSQKYGDNVQITVAETLGTEGRRHAYYDTAGAMRDMVQNHIPQLLCLIAMEPPSALDAQSIRDEKVKASRALIPLSRKEVAASTVGGQYRVGEKDSAVVKGYRQEECVDPRSTTETYVALRTKIDNCHWAGVPFLLRSGKRLPKRVSEIAIEFRQPPLHLFLQLASEDDVTPPRPKSNVLVLRIQPDEGVSLAFACKRPGMRIQL